MARKHIADRLQSLYWTEPNSGCWLFSGTLDPVEGYGRMKIGSRAVLAHRVSFRQHRGAIPRGLTLDHLCRNRPCGNPWHLEPVTAGVNVLRGASASAVNARKTECFRGHPFSPDNTTILAGRRGKSRRRCKACHRANQAPINARRSGRAS